MLIPYYYKSPDILTNQGTHNWPLSSTLELREVLTWPSKCIWPAPHWCSLLGPFFLCCAGVVGSRVCRVPHWWFSKHHHIYIYIYDRVLIYNIYSMMINFYYYTKITIIIFNIWYKQNLKSKSLSMIKNFII